MKFELESNDSQYRIQSYRPNTAIIINRIAYPHSVLISPHHLSNWSPTKFEELLKEHFEQICQLKVSVVLIGTGEKLQFPPQTLLTPLMKAGIGFEIMDTGAACRTFEVLASEGRGVAAALLL
ncbi:MAG: hypothetical protein RIT27_1675 [Pseudomonadota bacterium]